MLVSVGLRGGYLKRQGYYSAVPETSQAVMSADEWGQWFQGKAAAGNILSPRGDKPAGAICAPAGGSVTSMGKVACWNPVMDENQNLVCKWNEFITA